MKHHQINTRTVQRQENGSVFSLLFFIAGRLRNSAVFESHPWSGVCGMGGDSYCCSVLYIFMVFLVIPATKENHFLDRALGRRGFMYRGCHTA